MSASTGEASSGERVINISILQESSLSSLCKALAQYRAGGKTAAPKAAPHPPASVPKNRCHGGQKILGGAQILLGIVCISLGLVVAYQEFSPARIYSGAAFWMGGLFILSGISSILSGTLGSYWVSLATVVNLASVVAGCLALTQGVAPIPVLRYDFENHKSFCERRQHQPWVATTAPYESWRPSGAHESWREEECQRVLRNLLTVAIAVRVLLLIFSVVAMAAALLCFGCGLYVLYQQLQTSYATYVPLGDQEILPTSENRASTEHAT
ncbi:transmembrane protein 176B-like [Tiliqua scincoides]|uniref:transmembrane protein 176B-like n=1 Tax=Tiliqua scincoides TaxID=71010 RepID=UPI0034633DAF